MKEIEQWRPIPGWEGCYSASDFGRIRSEDRVLDLPSGQTRFYEGRVLSQYLDPVGRCQVNLVRGGEGGSQRVHRLILAAFVGPCPDGMEACHWDDDSSNNRLSNLRWDTPGDNALDRVRNGNHNHASKTHCPRGHEFTPENTYIRVGVHGRDCRTCWKMRPSSYKPTGTGNKDKTHCANGHEFTPENIYRRKGGGRKCRACCLAAEEKRRERRRSEG